MDEGLKGLDESQGRLEESCEDGHELDELMTNSASPIEIAWGLASQSASRLGFSQPLDTYELGKL